MLTKEDYENLITKIKGNIDDTTSALISEDLLNVISNYNNAIDEVDKLNKDINVLKTEKDELLKVNGKLFQKIGFQKEETNNEINPNLKQNEEVLKLEDIINEKGEMI